jgi:phenylalanyl-tRNA synthetase alpha chain
MDETQLRDLEGVHPELRGLWTEAAAAVAAASDDAALEDLRVRYLGRKSRLTEILRSIPTLPQEERPVVGRYGNLVRTGLERLVEERSGELAAAALQRSLSEERVDVTLPGVPLSLGHQHLITQTIRDVQDIFIGLGYRIAEGPEIELDYYNFTALNHPADHPARSLHDTFFIDVAGGPLRPAEGTPASASAVAGEPADGDVAVYRARDVTALSQEGDVLLRTHTSPVQIRTMEREEPPVYIICTGRTYRRDSDATHTPMFHQVEGLAVDEGITLSDLKGTLHHFVREFFGEDRPIRLRPHYFPFTEPSVELDVNCLLCGGKGCRSCKYSGWLEILGAGMVDPNLYGFVGYDADRLQGFAFGMGVERMAMLRHGIPDLRSFYDIDLRFLEQF